jgi:PKD repeat protein
MIGTRLHMVALGSVLALAACGGDKTKTSAPPPAKQPTTTVAAPAAAPATDAASDDDIAPLLAWADSDVDEGKPPLTVKFLADVEGGKPPLTYRWTFGDGTPDSTDANPVHVYQKAGQYTADLEVKDSSGDEDSDYLEIDVGD